MSEFLDTAVRAAHEAGAILREKLGKVGFREKSRADLGTEADVLAQRAIEEIVLDAFPCHCFLGEESQGKTPSFGDAFASNVPAGQMLREAQCGSAAPADKPYTWIVDPLDGTTNFVHRVPFFCTSIALARGNDIICAAIYNPNTNELYTAEKGCGAYLNGAKITTSSEEDPAHALVAISYETEARSDSLDTLAFQRCVTVCQALRRTGSTALNLAYVASGRFEGMSCQSAHPWDVAAGVLILQEAGGVATNTNGKPFDLANQPLLATANWSLQNHFLKVLNP